MTLANALRLLSVVLVALSMAAGFAHLYALPNKIGLPADEYFVTQQIYAGWALIGIAILGAIGSTFALAALVRNRGAEFWLVVTALACIVIALAIFFAFTFPANVATENWTTRPAGWETLRLQWEYSHAAGALLQLTALIALTLSLIVRGNRTAAVAASQPGRSPSGIVPTANGSPF